MSRRVVQLVLFCCAGVAFAVGQEDPVPLQSMVGTPRLSLDDSPETGALVDTVPSEPGILATEAPGFSAELHLLPATTQLPAAARVKNLRVASDVPSMKVVTKGPDTLVVGRTATYVIEVQNQSKFNAESVVVRCSIPSWVELKNHKASAGDVSVTAGADSIDWNIPGVTANGKHQLKFELVPRAGRAFDLNVELALQPRSSKTRVTIQEPKLKVKLDGPDSFVFDDGGHYKLTITNPGSAPATGVVVTIESHTQKIATKKIGDLPPQGERSVEVSLKGLQVGQFPLHVSALADLEVTNTAQKTVKIRRGSPNITIDGPGFEFAGTDSRYLVTVSNSGDAAMKNVDVTLSLPNKTSYISGLKNPTVGDGNVAWVVGSLAAGESKQFPVLIRLTERGRHQFAVKVSGNDLIASASTVTTADASADLKLVVNEPRGPQAVNKTVEYEIRISNTGSDTARAVSVIAAYPPELEVIDTTGGAAIKAGQIFFRPIKQIDRDKEVIHKVRLRALRAGSHSFKVAVKCLDPELRFVSEGTTRYFESRARVTRVENDIPPVRPTRVAENLPGIRPK